MNAQRPARRRTQTSRRIATVLGPLVCVTGLWAGPVQADHVSVMSVRQVAGHAAPNYDVTIRVEFQYSGNCCGGVFRWSTGELDSAENRRGSVPDGLSAGVYQGDQPLTAGTFAGGAGDEFHWTRSRSSVSGQTFVRVDITYSYAAPGVYALEWTGASSPTLVVVGVPLTPKHLLVPDTGSASLDAAFGLESIPPCAPLTDTAPVCYEKVSAAQMRFVNLDSYAAMVVGTDVNAVMLAELESMRDAIAGWLRSGNHGIAAYGESAAGGWEWLPTDGNLLLADPGLAQDVTVTPEGMLHASHTGQLPATLLHPGTLANWSPSAVNTFRAWPSHLEHVLAETASGDAVALAGLYPGGGCQVVTGQPVDTKVSVANPPARVLFRSTVAYALSCAETAFDEL